MTPEQKRLVRDTWRQLAPVPDAAAGMFYHRLFEIDPTTRKLFRATDMVAQRKKLLQIIKGLTDNDAEGLNRIAEKQRAYRNFDNAKDIAVFLAGQALENPPEIPNFEPRFPVLFQAAELYRRLESRR